MCIILIWPFHKHTDSETGLKPKFSNFSGTVITCSRPKKERKIPRDSGSFFFRVCIHLKMVPPWPRCTALSLTNNWIKPHPQIQNPQQMQKHHHRLPHQRILGHPGLMKLCLFHFPRYKHFPFSPLLDQLNLLSSCAFYSSRRTLFQHRDWVRTVYLPYQHSTTPGINNKPE